MTVSHGVKYFRKLCFFSSGISISEHRKSILENLWIVCQTVGVWKKIPFNKEFWPALLTNTYNDSLYTSEGWFADYLSVTSTSGLGNLYFFLCLVTYFSKTPGLKLAQNAKEANLSRVSKRCMYKLYFPVTYWRLLSTWKGFVRHPLLPITSHKLLEAWHWDLWIYNYRPQSCNNPRAISQYVALIDYTWEAVLACSRLQM